MNSVKIADMKCRYGLVIAALVMLLGCREIYNDDGYLFLSSSRCLFGAEGGVRYLTVTSSGDYEIGAADLPGWCEANKEYGKIRVEVSANELQTSRSVSFPIVLSSNGVIDSVTVVQAPYTASGLELSYDGDEYVFDATGGVFCISVMHAAQWDAELDSDYYSIETDKKAGTVVVTAPVNESQDSHAVTMTVSAVIQGVVHTEEIQLKQLRKSESPYYSFVGRWDMYSSEWVISSEKIKDGGTYTSCDIVEDVIGESYLIKGLFYASEDGQVQTVIPAIFNPETGNMEIAVGNEVGLYLYGLFPVYLMMCDLDKGNLMYDKLLVCSSSESGSRIDIEGFEKGYGWGCFLYKSDQYQVLEGMPYAVGEECYMLRGGETNSELSTVLKTYSFCQTDFKTSAL